MHLDPYTAALRDELDAVGATGGPEIADAAARLSRAVDPAARLVMLDALSAAVAEIDLELADRVPELGARVGVDLRLRGRTAGFAVEVTPVQDAPVGEADPAAAPTAGPDAGPDADDGSGGSDGSDGPVARLTVRLPEAVKSQVEAAAARAGTSVNAWVNRVLADAATGGGAWGGTGSYPVPVAPLPPRPTGPPTGPAPGPRTGPRPGGAGRRLQGWVR